MGKEISESFSLMQWLRRSYVGGKLGGIREAIVNTETGFLVEYNHVDKLADRVAFLYGDRGMANKMGLDG